jgi:hypothetical protein
VANPGLTDTQINEAWQALQRANGNISEAARLCGLNRGTYINRLDAAKRIFCSETPIEKFFTVPPWQYLNIHNGSIVIASDAHVWPFARSTSAHALIEVTKAEQPVAIIANGDFIDGARSNRHDPDGWNMRPDVRQEVEGVQSLLHDWQQAAPRATRMMTRGNHEMNFDRKLVKVAKEFEGMPGFDLESHLQDWPMSIGIRVNWRTPGATCIKHRFASGGVNAARNATMKAGTNTISGHTHQLGAAHWCDYNGHRWGIETGCLTDPRGPQFEYDEQNPRPQCEGFAVVTYRDGIMLPPEFCYVIEGKAWFRNKVWAEGDAEPWEQAA